MIPVVTIDLETYWSDIYTLKKMTPLQYVMDERFEAQLMALKVDDEETRVYVGAEIGRALREIDWSDKAICGHNMSGFDSYILAYRFGVVPRMWMCTLAMARPLYAKQYSLSLGSLCKELGIGTKDQSVLMQTKGRYLHEFSPHELAHMRVYNRDDTDMTRALFKRLLPHFSASELWQIDALTRMRTEPQFVLNRSVLEAAAAMERDRKLKQLFALGQMLGWAPKPVEAPVVVDMGVDTDDVGVEAEITQLEIDIADLQEYIRSVLASAPAFSSLLTNLGVPTPVKPSPTNPEQMIPALAKTDEAFEALLEHPNELVAAAARARMDVKSTLLETRIEKFLTAGELADGRLPITLRYCGADTTGRDSGEEYNPQNLPRINKKKARPSDALRLSLCAPNGHTVIVADQSGIEMRVNHFLWKVPFTMQVYEADPAADLYRASGAKAMGVRPEDLSPEERQMEKVKMLGLGFGAGAKTFQRIARVMGGMTISEEDSKEFVDDWRTRHSEIAAGWKTCDKALNYVVDGRPTSIDPWGMVSTGFQCLRLPSGRFIRYPMLRYLDEAGVILEFFGGVRPGLSPEQYDKQVTRRTGWWYASGKNRARLTGPKVCENIVQALARDSLFDAAVNYYRITGRRPALRVHDELIYVVPTREADKLLATLQYVLRTPPLWWPQLVVWSEGGSGPNYGLAK